VVIGILLAGVATLLIYESGGLQRRHSLSRVIRILALSGPLRAGMPTGGSLLPCQKY
jgi:hypothetical protein